MPGAFQTHHCHIDALSLHQDGIISNTVQSQMAISPIRTYIYFTILNLDNDLVHDNFHISVYIKNITFETSILLTQGLLPASILIPQFIQLTENTIVIRALFDSGGTVTLVHAHVLTTGVVPTQSNKQTFTTIARLFGTKQCVWANKWTVAGGREATEVEIKKSSRLRCRCQGKVLCYCVKKSVC